MALLTATLTGRAGGDEVAAYLERHGLQRLLAVHLEHQLEAQTSKGREEIVLRLADIYARLLEVTEDPVLREHLVDRSRKLLAVASASAGQDLRLALLRGQYRAAEKIAESHRLRQAGPQELERAREILSEVIPKLTRLRNQVGERLRVTERRLMRATGGDAVVLAEEAERIQRLYSQCTFVTAWALYYQSWLHDRSDNAKVAGELFAELVAADSPRPQPDEVSVDLRSVEAVARAILGMALCKSLTASSATSLRWLELLTHEQANADLREQVPAWRMAIHLEHGEYRAARAIFEGLVGSEGESPPVAWIRLVAVHALEAQDRSRHAAELARLAVARLAARGELKAVLDLSERYGLHALGTTGFAFRYVRGVGHYQRAREEHGTDHPTTVAHLVLLYRQAADEFEGAVGEADADRYPEAAASCRWLIGWCAYFSGRFLAARQSFELAAETLAPDQASEALWMAVVSLDRAVQAGRSSDAELTKLIDRVLARFPVSPYASKLRLKRALQSEPSPQVVEELLSIESDSEVYETAHRRAAQMLYQLFRGADGEQRVVYGNEFLSVALPLIEAGTPEIDRDVTLLRRALEVALADGIERIVAAERVLEELDELEQQRGAVLAAHRDELDFRRVQVHLGSADHVAAAAIADRLWERDRTAAWSRLAEGAIFRYGLRRWRGGQRPASLGLVIRHGRRIVSLFAGHPDALQRPSVLATHVAVAEALMLAGQRDPVLEREALDLYEKLLAVRPGDAGFLRATAILSERLDKTDQALSCWRALVAGTTVGDPLWYEAKFRLISLLAERDPQRARSVMDQHKHLNPGYGPEPWASRLRELDRRLPPPASDGGAPT